jgi:hypothetical protein
MFRDKLRTFGVFIPKTRDSIMAEITVKNESIEMETSKRNTYKIEFSFKKDNKPDKIFSFEFNPSIYMDKTIISRSDLTFEVIEQVIEDYFKNSDRDYQIDEIYNIKVQECSTFKVMSNPGWKD